MINPTFGLASAPGGVSQARPQQDPGRDDPEQNDQLQYRHIGPEGNRVPPVSAYLTADFHQAGRSEFAPTKRQREAARYLPDQAVSFRKDLDALSRAELDPFDATRNDTRPAGVTTIRRRLRLRNRHR